MYGLDNASGVNVMPPFAPVGSATPLWFTEGGAGLAASYPGQDWFNMVQAEILNVLTKAGIKPVKGKLTQLSEAISKIVSDANYVTKTDLANGLNGKLGNTGEQSLRSGSLHIYNSGSALLRLISASENSNYIAFHKNNSVSNSERTAYVGFGENDTKEFRITNDKAGRTLVLSESGLSVSGFGAVMYARDYKTDRNGCLKISDAPELSDYPVGAPIPWAQATAPEGYLLCNGQTFNKTTYPLLAKAYPSGKIDDLRAEFIRGLDAGRGIDAGRTVLSKQGDAIRNITGSIYARAARTTGANTLSSSGVFVDTDASWEADSIDTSATKQIMKGSELDVSRVVPTANENRPRNTAYLYIVRAA